MSAKGSEEIGSLNSVVEVGEKKLLVPKKLPGRDVVNCPMVSVHRSVVDLHYCKVQCSFFIKVIEDTELGTRISCKFPRTLAVINVMGEVKV